jgi:hypothetical protein
VPYTIPNEAGAGFADQAEPDKVDFDILTAGVSHGTGGSGFGRGPTGVESGCTVTAQGTPDMTVAVAAGVARIGGRRVVVAGGNVTITTADGTNPRFDLIVVDTAGTKTAIAGTAASNAVFPAITTGKIVLAAVYVPASDTAINTNQITDKRVMVPSPPIEDVTWYGAVGDSTGDQTVAIQAALDAADAITAGSSTSRAVVYFPPTTGKWRITGQLTWKLPTDILGTGSSILYAGSALAANEAVITTENTAAQNVQGCRFERMAVEGGSAGNILADYGIKFIEGSGKVDFGTAILYSGGQYFNKAAIRFEGGITNAHIRRCRWDHCPYAIEVARPTTANRTNDFLTVEECTYDNQSSTLTGKGFILLDQTNFAVGDGTTLHVKLQNARVELNKEVITTTTSGLTLPQATIAVTSTTGFDTAGKISIQLTNGTKQDVDYTGTSGGNSFTGCTGGAGAYSNGAQVVQGISGGVIDCIQPTTDNGDKLTHFIELDNFWVGSSVAQGDAFPIIKVRKADGSAGISDYLVVMAINLDPRTSKLIETARNTSISIGNQFRVPYWSHTTWNGSPAASQAPVLWMSPVWWREVPVPATPPAKYHAFYVDPADSLLKSKNSAGIITVYGSRVRSLYIDGSVLRMDAATGIKLGIPPNAVDGVSLANGLTSGAYCNFIMPVDVTTGTITVRPIWVPSATDGTAHTVRWQMNTKIISATDVTAAGTSTPWTGDSATRTINVEVLETGGTSGISPAANDRVRLEIQRVGADGADTYVGDVYLIGLRIDYLANN